MHKKNYKPFVGNKANVEERVQEETPELLKKYQAEFQKQITNATSRKVRVEQLMMRYSAKKWDAKKRAKMMRRHVATIDQIDSATKILDQINDRLSQTVQQ